MHRVVHWLASAAIVFVLGSLFFAVNNPEIRQHLRGDVYSSSNSTTGTGLRCDGSTYENDASGGGQVIVVEVPGNRQPRPTDADLLGRAKRIAMDRVRTDCTTQSNSLTCADTDDCMPKTPPPANPRLEYDETKITCRFVRGPLYQGSRSQWYAEVTCIVQPGACKATLECEPKPWQICCHDSQGNPTCTSDAQCPAGQQQSGSRTFPSECAESCQPEPVSVCCQSDVGSYAECRESCEDGEEEVSLTPNATECNVNTCKPRSSSSSSTSSSSSSSSSSFSTTSSFSSSSPSSSSSSTTSSSLSSSEWSSSDGSY